MQIYLLKDLKGHGKAGEIVELSDGYAKNFVLKNQIGRVADNAVRAAMKDKAASDNYKTATEIAATQALITKLQTTPVVIRQKTGANNKLFGSITTAEIAAAAAKVGLTVDKRHLVLPAPIKTTGSYNINVKFPHNLTGVVHLTVEDSNAK